MTNIVEERTSFNSFSIPLISFLPILDDFTVVTQKFKGTYSILKLNNVFQGTARIFIANTDDRMFGCVWGENVDVYHSAF